MGRCHQSKVDLSAYRTLLVENRLSYGHYSLFVVSIEVYACFYTWYVDQLGTSLARQPLLYYAKSEKGSGE